MGGVNVAQFSDDVAGGVGFCSVWDVDCCFMARCSSADWRRRSRNRLARSNSSGVYFFSKGTSAEAIVPPEPRNPGEPCAGRVGGTGVRGLCERSRVGGMSKGASEVHAASQRALLRWGQGV